MDSESTCAGRSKSGTYGIKNRHFSQQEKQEIDECHQALSEVLGKPERRLVLQIIDAKDRIAEDTSIDSFITGFELAWKLSMELNYYENERSVSCRTAMELRARFTSKEEEK